MKVKIKSENRQNLDVLLDKLKSIATIDENGRLTFCSIKFEDIYWLFLSIIDFGNLLNIDSQRDILTNTFKEIVKKQCFDKESFLNILNDQFTIYNQQEFKTYYLLSTFSIKNLPFRKIKIVDNIIQIHGKQFPKTFRNERKNLLKSIHFSDDIPSYSKISIQIKSKDYKDAYTKGLFSLEILRSFLCLLLNHGFEIRFGERSRKPINRVLRGETTTLHFPNGKTVDQNFVYFTPDYKTSNDIILTKEETFKIKSSIKWLIKSFNKCKPKHQNAISQTLNCYVDALDEFSYDLSFLKIWTALEKITNTDSNDELIKRCLALVKPESKSFHRQRLESLRLFRNEFVHEGFRDLDPFHACYVVQEYLYSLITFNLKLSGFFKGIDEANVYLDSLSSDTKELLKRKRIIDKVLKNKQ